MTTPTNPDGDRLDSPMRSLPRVQVTDREHPHFEEYGRFTGKMISVLGKTMAEISLEHCRHGVDGCFVQKGQVTFVRER